MKAIIAMFFVMMSAGVEQPGEDKGVGLAELLSAALAHDGRVLAAEAQLDVYRAQLKEARWAWFPQIKLQALFGGPVGERKLACNQSEPNCMEVTDASRGGDFSFGNLSFALGGRLEGALPLYTFGKLDAAKQAAAAGVSAGEAQIEYARQQVALEVRRAYYGWLLAKSTEEVLEDSQNKIREAEKKLIKMLDELNEEVTDRDLFKLRYHAAQLDAWLERSRQGQRLALSALRFLTGWEELGEQQPLEYVVIEVSAEKQKDRQWWISWARTRRPELRMLVAAQKAAEANVDATRAQLYPDFFLFGYLEGSWSPVQDYIENPLLQPGLTRYDAAIALGMRVTFDIPQKLARLEKAEAELARLRAQANQAEEATVLQIDQRLAEMGEAISRLKIKKRAKRSAESWMRANLMSYGVGVFDTKDLLDSVAARALSVIELDQVQHDARLALDQLLAAAGSDLGRLDGDDD